MKVVLEYRFDYEAVHSRLGGVRTELLLLVSCDEANKRLLTGIGRLASCLHSLVQLSYCSGSVHSRGSNILGVVTALSHSHRVLTGTHTIEGDKAHSYTYVTIIVGPSNN